MLVQLAMRRRRQLVMRKRRQLVMRRRRLIATETTIEIIINECTRKRRALERLERRLRNKRQLVRRRNQNRGWGTRLDRYSCFLLMCGEDGEERGREGSRTTRIGHVIDMCHLLHGIESLCHRKLSTSRLHRLWHSDSCLGQQQYLFVLSSRDGRGTPSPISSSHHPFQLYIVSYTVPWKQWQPPVKETKSNRLAYKYNIKFESADAAEEFNQYLAHICLHCPEKYLSFCLGGGQWDFDTV